MSMTGDSQKADQCKHSSGDHDTGYGTGRWRFERLWRVMGERAKNLRLWDLESCRKLNYGCQVTAIVGAI